MKSTVNFASIHTKNANFVKKLQMVDYLIAGHKCKEPELDQVQRHVVYCAVYILSRVVLNTPASCLSHAMGTEEKIAINVLKSDAVTTIYPKPCQAEYK